MVNGAIAQWAGDKTPVVLVGYDIRQDINAMRQLGVDLCKTPNLIDLIDVKRVHQYFHRRQDGRSLAFVLDSLDVQNIYLHNAGNDAVYTLQALIAMAVAKGDKKLEPVYVPRRRAVH